MVCREIPTMKKKTGTASKIINFVSSSACPRGPETGQAAQEVGRNLEKFQNLLIW
jgi:hypothetical protein